MGENLFFDGIQDLIRITVAAPVVYGVVILWIRMSGKRSTSQMNSFDWIVTVAMGSIVGSGVMMDGITIVEAVWAIGLLLLLQWLLTLGVSRSERLAAIVKPRPRLLYYQGTWCDDALRVERVTRGEVLSSIRQHGFARLEEVWAVVLETEGKMSVVGTARLGTEDEPTALAGVRADPRLAQFGEVR